MSSKFDVTGRGATSQATALDTLGWVKEQLDAGRDAEIVHGILHRDRGAGQIGAALRNSIEHQIFQVGRTTYHSHVFSIPIVIEAPSALDEEAFDLDEVLGLIVRTLRDNGLAGRNAMLLNRIVPHAQLVALASSDLYALGQEMFFMSTAAGQSRDHLSRLRTLRAGAQAAQESADELEGRTFHLGHILGCVYGTRGRDTRLDNLDGQRVARRLTSILEYSLAASHDAPVRVRVGRPESLCAALGQAMLAYAQEVGEVLIGSVSAAAPATRFDIHIDDRDEAPLDHLVTLRLTERGTTTGVFGINLTMHESAALEPIVSAMQDLAEEHGLEAPAPIFSADRTRH